MARVVMRMTLMRGSDGSDEFGDSGPLSEDGEGSEDEAVVDGEAGAGMHEADAAGGGDAAGH
jgi:hypothetical protein